MGVTSHVFNREQRWGFVVIRRVHEWRAIRQELLTKTTSAVKNRIVAITISGGIEWQTREQHIKEERG